MAVNKLEQRPSRSAPPSYPFYHWTNLLTLLIGILILSLLELNNQRGYLASKTNELDDYWTLHQAYLVRPGPWNLFFPQKYKPEELAWLAKSIVWPLIALGLVGVWFGLRIISAVSRIRISWSSNKLPQHKQ